MARPQNVQEFITRHEPQIRDVHEMTGIPPSCLVAQWGLESGWGSSKLYLEGKNFIGMRKYERHDYAVDLGKNGLFAGYLSYDECAADYVWLLRDSGIREDAGYTDILEAAEKLYSGRDDRDATRRRAVAVLEAMARSSYCAHKPDLTDGYNQGGVLAGKLIMLLDTYDLVALDEPIHIAPYVGDEGPPVDEVALPWLEREVTWPAKEAAGEIVDAAKDALGGATGALKGAAYVGIALALLALFLSVLGAARGLTAER